MKRVKDNSIWNWHDALAEAEISFAEVVRVEVRCKSCGERAEIKFPEMHVTHATEKHLKDYFDGALEEAYNVLDKALHLLKTGKEEINDDTGDSELTLTSGDFWVSTMNDIVRVLKKARGEQCHTE